MANASVFSSSHGNDVQGISINDSRRKFNFGERVAELAPQQSPFFVYLNKVAKKATDDPVFKFLEQRHQWQRRNFNLGEAVGSAAYTSGTTYINDGGDDLVQTYVYYDKYGSMTGTTKHKPEFLLEGQIVAIEDSTGTVRRFKVDATPDVTSGAGEQDVKLKALFSATCVFNEDAKCQVIGSAFAEGTGAPGGWEDALYDREGYCQIFKTGMNIFSGSAMATSYRGVANEWQRVWQEKLMEHKMDIEHAMLFGIGSSNQEQSPTGAPLRYSHGILPYTETNGKVYSMSYASSGYDAFLDAMEDFFAPESGNSGNKLVLASRKVITYLNKLGNGSFMNNSVGSSQYRLDIESIPGSFGHTVTKVNTIFGNLHFVADPLLRGPWENYCCAVDMSNVAYRPLVGNGVSRDTFIETNVQSPDIDGRQDQIITEAGLEISLPETHAILKFS
jgi:hypothetical protein